MYPSSYLRVGWMQIKVSTVLEVSSGQPVLTSRAIAGNKSLVFDCIANPSLKSRVLRNPEFKVFLIGSCYSYSSELLLRAMI